MWRSPSWPSSGLRCNSLLDDDRVFGGMAVSCLSSAGKVRRWEDWIKNSSAARSSSKDSLLSLFWG